LEAERLLFSKQVRGEGEREGGRRGIPCHASFPRLLLLELRLSLGSILLFSLLLHGLLWAGRREGGREGGREEGKEGGRDAMSGSG